jgi:hypothetical protein
MTMRSHDLILRRLHRSGWGLPWMLTMLLLLPAGTRAASLQAAIVPALHEGLNGAVWSAVSPGAGADIGAAGVKNAATGEPMPPIPGCVSGRSPKPCWPPACCAW